MQTNIQIFSKINLKSVLTMSASKPKAVIYTSPKRSLYVGKLEPVLKRANVNATLLVSTGEDLTLLSSSGKPLAHSKSLLVPAGLDITIDTRNANIAVFSWMIWGPTSPP